MGTSQTMPTTAPAPPAWREKNRGDQFCSSPKSRRRVMAKVITAGIRISDIKDRFCASVVISHPPGSSHWRRGPAESSRRASEPGRMARGLVGAAAPAHVALEGQDVVLLVERVRVLHRDLLPVPDRAEAARRQHVGDAG